MARKFLVMYPHSSPRIIAYTSISVFLFITLAINVETVPVTPAPHANIHCPVPTTSDEFGTHKVLNLNEIKGQKVRLQFFYPREEASKRLLDSREISLLERDAANKGNQTGETTTESGTTSPGETSTNKDVELFNQDILCQWTFRAGNDSGFLSLTFETLSAPYSEDCTQAFVALQKENGYESRWCGNRRQANARPMSLLARSSAVITVFRSGDAPLLPPTGFKVSVRVVDASSLQGTDTSLRILRG